MNVVPVTSFAGYKDFGSFSPDGERIVFSWNGGRGGSGGRQERNLYWKNIANGEPVRLTFVQQDDTHPDWSPDGRYIAFCRKIERLTPHLRFAVYTIPAGGGQECRIAEGGEGVSWSPDGSVLAVAGLPPESGGIFRVSVESGVRTQLTGSSLYDELPVFSPDGQWLAYTVVGENYFTRVRLFSFATERATDLVDRFIQTDNPVFGGDNLLYFTASIDSGPTRSGLDMSTQERPIRKAIYAAVLAADGHSPLPPRSDDEELPGKSKAPTAPGRAPPDRG